MHKYKCYNGAMATTAAQAKVTTGTAIKTMLQINTPSTRQIQLLEWGYSIDVFSTATGQVELIETDVAATVTAHVAAGVQPLTPGQPASLMTLGTANTGFTSSAEGTTTASRTFDAQQVLEDATTMNVTYTREWIPGLTSPIVAVSKFLRVRCTFTAAVNMTCWVVWDE
jgi:hypothetical protein